MKLINYLKDTRSEMRHVSWPTRKQTIQFTMLVVVISIVTTILLGSADSLFAYLFEEFII